MSTASSAPQKPVRLAPHTCLLSVPAVGFATKRQLCGLAGVPKDTVSQLSPSTAALVFGETMPQSNKPLQVFSGGDLIRSIHGHRYTRLHNADLVTMLREFAVDFQPPQKASI